jgi:hypothetical protein
MRRLVPTNVAAWAVDVGPRQLAQWLEQGLVQPGRRDATGSPLWDVDRLDEQVPPAGHRPGRCAR